MAARTSRCVSLCSRRCHYNSYSTASSESSAPPLLLKLRSEMKTAMKMKDTNRLNVLRAVLAETTNASKTASPIKTDVQLLSLLRKRITASKSAADEFHAANRDDLRDKEQAQVAVMEEYASNVELVGRDEIITVAEELIGKMREDGQTVGMGSVLKALVGVGGRFEGKPIDKGEVAQAVKGLL